MVRRPSLAREVVLATLASVVLACVMNPIQLRGLTTTVAGDLGDPLYFSWQFAWVSHALATSPGGLWTTNAFSQAPGNLAFTDTVLGYAPLGLVVPGGQAGALAQLNLAGLIATALATLGGYALARAMGAGPVAALTAGAGFGYAPWRLEQVIHINVVSSGGIALTLACLSRGSGWSLRHGWRPERMSWRWIAAGWAVAAWQLTLGFATGIWFVWTLALVMSAWAVGWAVRGRRRAGLPRPVVLAHGVGGSAFLLLLALLLRPYLLVLSAHPEARRGENWLPLFSPPWRGLLTAPSTSQFWGDRQHTWRDGLTWQPEMVLSPGLVLIALALTGLVVSVWPLRRRLALAGVTALLVVLAMGTAFPGGGRWTYLPLYHYAPGWSALRTPGRLMIWVTLGLALLAAGAVARFFEEVRPARLNDRANEPANESGSRRGLLLRTATATALACLPALLVVTEGANNTPHWRVATAPVRLRTLPQPLLLLPTDLIGDYHMMLWSTDGFPVIANGNSGFDPTGQARLRTEALTFPDAESIDYLRSRGIRAVVITRSRTVGGPWQAAADRPVTGLGIRRIDLGDGVVYDLEPR